MAMNSRRIILAAILLIVAGAATFGWFRFVAHPTPVACGIPGTSVRTAYLCRDKPAMKEALREAGIRTAQSTGASTSAEVREFVATVGYPIILKPRAAAGAS